MAKRKTSRRPKTTRNTRRTAPRVGPSARAAARPARTTTAPAARSDAAQRECVVPGQLPRDVRPRLPRGARHGRDDAEACGLAGHKELSKAVKDLDVHYDQTTQVPNMIIARRPRSRCSAKRVAGTPESAVTDVHPAARRSLEAFERRHGHDRSGVGQPAAAARPRSKPGSARGSASLRLAAASASAICGR